MTSADLAWLCGHSDPRVRELADYYAALWDAASDLHYYFDLAGIQGEAAQAACKVYQAVRHSQRLQPAPPDSTAAVLMRPSPLPDWVLHVRRAAKPASDLGRGEAVPARIAFELAARLQECQKLRRSTLRALSSMTATHCPA